MVKQEPMKLLSFSLLMAVATSNFQHQAAEVVPVKLQQVNDTVKVYPTPDNEGSITVHSANKATLSFYLFDLEGKLIFQTALKQNQKQTVNGLTKGTYLYNAFEKDENIKGGNVILK